MPRMARVGHGMTTSCERTAAARGSVEWANAGVIARVNRGVIDPVTHAGFHGLVGLDFDGNGTVDAMTYIVGPEGDALPDGAVLNGSPNHGIVALDSLPG